MSNKISYEELKQRLPMSQGRLLTTKVVDMINDINSSEDFHKDQFIENMISYSSVLTSGRYKVEDYLKAVEFLSYKACGHTQLMAYEKTFREEIMIKMKTTSRSHDYTSAASNYAKGKLVTSIMAQAQIPLNLFFAQEKFKLVGVLLDLAYTSKNERIRMESADKALSQLQDPTDNKIEIDVNIKGDSAVRSLEEKMNQMAILAKENIEKGVSSLKQLADSKTEEIIDAEVN
jgi:hypothetical protein